MARQRLPAPKNHLAEMRASGVRGLLVYCSRIGSRDFRLGMVNGVSAQQRSPKLKFPAQRCKDPEHGQDTPCTMGFPQAFHSHNGMKIS